MSDVASTTSADVSSRRRRARIIGPGRAGGSLASALSTIGWDVLPILDRRTDQSAAANGVDLVVVATPDRMIRQVARGISANPGALVVHVAGSLGLDVLGNHPRRGALHPLVSMPDVRTGAQRLAGGAWFGLAADHDDDRALLESVVSDLGGHAFAVDDTQRVAYHATAVVASNHLVALLGQVQRLASACDVPYPAFLALATQTLQGLATASPAEILTGPVRRGDWDTVARHLAVIDEAERPGYAALAELATRLADRNGQIPDFVAAARREDIGAGEDPSR